MSNHRHKILVVEDDQNLRLTLTELLRMEGFTVVSARDGDEGYLQAMAHQPDLVITDLNMPILNGVELAGSCAVRGARWPRFRSLRSAETSPITTYPKR